jgi:asparagine synthase (glutamine-hydrolysing)
MCGIFAWVGPGFDEKRLTQCTDRLAHRGPDAAGYWNDGLAYLGHRRLKIIDLSEAGAQPMFNEDGQVVVIFNGEIYNFPELRADLEAKGHVFRSHSDTEVIVHGYEEYGDECVQKFWGMFALAIWDRRRKRMLVARDRFGKKPVNYLHKGQNLVIASEIPAILESGLSSRTLSLDSLALFWQLEFIPAPYSAFGDIQKLPAGHAMVFEGSNLKIWQYYPPREVAPFTGSYDQAKEQLKSLLSDATSRRLVSDVPVGVALSGGIDSAVVVAAARKLTSGRLVTVTVRPHLERSELDEGDFARATAKALGTEHHEIRPVPDFRQSFETIIRNLAEPFAISSVVPSYYLFSMLRTMATVVVTGDGGDELFAGYDYYRQINLFRKLRRAIPGPLLTGTYSLFNQIYGLGPALRPRLKNLLAGLQVLNRQPPRDALWEQRRVLRLDVFRKWCDLSRSRELDRQIESYFTETDPMRLTMLCEQFNRMTYHILTKVDISSMAHAVEVRAPLLDHRIAEFARSLPTEFLIGDGRGKRILRDIASDVLPPEVLSKPKTGFIIPIRDLFANELRPYLLETLTAPDPIYDELVDRSRIPEVIDAHCAGKPYETALLLKLLSLRLWIQFCRPVNAG